MTSSNVNVVIGLAMDCLGICPSLSSDNFDFSRNRGLFYGRELFEESLVICHPLLKRFFMRSNPIDEIVK